jgi:hypothetical protein
LLDVAAGFEEESDEEPLDEEPFEESLADPLPDPLLEPDEPVEADDAEAAAVFFASRLSVR